MCRWMAWLGQPVLIEELLFKAPHGIVDQSLHARMGAEPTNGDGFGLGWYGTGDGPGIYRSVSPAWGDPNLRELAAHVESPLFMAHVRAAIGSPVQETNCHPFRHGGWLFVHNGFIADFHLLRRDLMLAIDPDLFPLVQGSTDTEVVFYLALTLGLEQDPIAALERTVGLIEQTGRSHGVTEAVQASFGASDGDSLWAVRYATGGSARSLFASADADALRHLYPDNAALQQLTEDDRLIVSEPFSDLPGRLARDPGGDGGDRRARRAARAAPVRTLALIPCGSARRMPDYRQDLQFGVFITPVAAQADAVVELARLADVVGLDLVSFQDHPYQPSFLDTWTLLSVVAAETTNVRVAPNVANVPLRPPALLARSAASLDILSGGRVELGPRRRGVLGRDRRPRRPALTPGQGVDALAEAIDVIRAFWTGDGPIRHQGAHYTVDGAQPGPPPAHDIEIWLGAYKPRMLGLTGAKADGWVPSQAYVELEQLPGMNARDRRGRGGRRDAAPSRSGGCSTSAAASAAAAGSSRVSRVTGPSSSRS